MKNIELFELFKALENINLSGAKFAYGIAKNINILKPHAIAISKAQEYQGQFKEYIKEKTKILKKLADKDEKGRQIKEGDSFKVSENLEQCLDEVKVIDEKYKDAIEQRKVQMEEFEKLLEEPVSIELHKIKLEHVPQDITSSQMKSIISLIEE